MTRSLLGVILAFAFASRLWMAIATPLIYDEYQWTALVDSVDLHPSQLTLPMHGDQHPPAEIYVAAAGTAIFGHNLLGYRVASVFLGTLAVFLMYVLGNRLAGPSAGLLAAALLAANEYHIGISRLCTEKNYLTFALAAIIAFDRALERPSLGRWLTTGVILGLGTLTKEAMVLWVPLFGLEIIRRRAAFLRDRGPYLAVAVMLLMVTPDIWWNVAHRPASTTSSEWGAAYQLSRLSIGHWSWGPLALYIRPLYFYGVERDISEYASMTTIAGGMLLVGAATSVFVCRSARARFLQILGFTTFMFFCLFTTPRGEFWWADLTVLPFVALTAAVTTRVRGIPGRAAAGLALVVVAVTAARVITTPDNYFSLEWGSPPASLVDWRRHSEALLIAQFPQRDHLALCSLGGPQRRLPACGQYERGFALYEEYLDGLQTGSITPDSAAWPTLTVSNVETERARVRAERRRFLEASNTTQ